MTTASTRIEGVDFLRGLVMALMVLDHVREFVTDPAIDPTDLQRASPGLFLTRWATHLCAPTFALLAGVGVRLAGVRKDDRRSLALSLLTRGLWLIVLEQTVAKFGLLFRPAPDQFIGLVLWSIGGSFVLLAACIAANLPAWAVGALGALIVAGHNAFDGLAPGIGGPLRSVAEFLLRPSVFQLPGGATGFIGYPLLPWFGVVALGYRIGGAYAMEPRRRRLLFGAIGVALLAGFALLRSTGFYGDPNAWRTGDGPTSAILGFLNCTKYPPSLQFLAMTLGPALLILAASDGGVGSAGRLFNTVGRVPLFFYLLQWYVIHGLVLGVAAARGEPTAWLFAESLPILPPPSCVYALPALYVWWIVVLVTMAPLCVWYAGYKRRHRASWWIGYV